MAVSLNDIKNKIASTKNTSQITNAMQMVSAAKLGKSEEAAKNFQVYAQKVRKLVTDMLHGHEAENARHHSMLISRPVKKSAYIATNVISITDGQIFLSDSLFNAGVRPAIDAGSSVSRVGGSAQIKAMKKVAGTLRIDLASYRELEAFTKFGSDLDAATQAKLNRGRRTVEVLKQPIHEPLPVEKQVVILYALTHGFLDSVPVDDILRFESELFAYFDAHQESIYETIRTTKDLPSEEVLDAAITEFIDQSSFK